MKLIELEEMKRLELDMLIQFARYCDENFLRYYLYAGTLLGAVRHQGFIPWDDDIDVVMPRPDYERFLKMASKQPIASHIDVLSYRSKQDYVFPFAKLTDIRTDGQEAYIDRKYHNGVWIDVFPLDGLPSDVRERNCHIKRQQRRIRWLGLCVRPFVPSSNVLKCIKRLLVYPIYLINHRKNQLSKARELDENAKRYAYDDSELVGVTCFCGGLNNVVEKDCFETTLDFTFEGAKFRVPVGYKEYLSHLFGSDYMTPPPHNKRVQLHGYRAWWKDGCEPDRGQV